jgi:hypothetical protein
MDDAILDCLRCPIDPTRESTLRREEQQLVCACDVRFPIRQGLPILVTDEAELPTGMVELSQLPCRRGKRRNPK